MERNLFHGFLWPVFPDRYCTVQDLSVLDSAQELREFVGPDTPLGDLPGTLLALVVPNPQVRWQFRYTVTLPGVGEAHSFTFDSDEIVRVLGDIPFSDPDVLAFLRAHLTEGIAALQAECK